MKRFRGFKLKHQITTLFRRNRRKSEYHLLDQSRTCKAKPISRLLCWGRSLKAKAKGICSKNSGTGYFRIGSDHKSEEPVAVPKGQMAVYVGQKDGDCQRVLVPVIYFNHPLFGQLLREAEEEYGFSHPGGIIIPCRISEFEDVQTRIAAGCGIRKLLTWRRTFWLI